MFGGKGKHLEWAEAALLIVTQDKALLEILGGKLRQWGATVHHHEPGKEQGWSMRIIDVVLVDVRHHAEKMLGGLRGLRESMPFAEMILINRSDNVNGSMAGMKAGASDELTAPFDMEKLKLKVAEACLRSRRKCARSRKRSLLEVFEDSMSAAAFAQAGEFETAISLMETATPEGNPAEGRMNQEGRFKKENTGKE